MTSKIHLLNCRIFFFFLEEHNLLYRWSLEVYRQTNRWSITNLQESDVRDWINSSFDWETSRNGWSFWNEIDRDWKHYYKPHSNLKIILNTSKTKQ